MGSVRGVLKRLHEGARKRLSTVLASSSRGKLRSALRHFARFADAVPDRDLFNRDPLHNEWTMCLYLEYCAVVKSKRTGKPIAVNSAAEYASMLTAHWSREMGFPLIGNAAQRFPSIIRQMRKTTAPSTRRERRGLRRHQLQAAWRCSATLRARTPEAANVAAAISVSWQALARAGELTATRFDPDKHPTRADLVKSGSAEKGDEAYTLWLVPLKKSVAEKVPIMFAKGGGDIADTYSMLERLEAIDPVPRARRAVTPVFRVGKAALKPSRFLRAVRDFAKAAGQDPTKYGKHSGRIGGATDLADSGASPLLLQAKGRWAGDLGRIYARMTRRGQLAASRKMMRARVGRDLEELFPGFVQPA